MANTPKSTSYRLPQDTRDKLKSLKKFLKESETALLTRAVDLLYEQREEVLKKDLQERMNEK